ncbi:MAG: sensor histidine kinase [Butyricimonas paravirosa]
MKNTEQRQRILENLVYALAWIIVFAVPVLHFDRETGLNWDDISREWMIILPFFMLFCVHNYLLLPFFLLDKKPWQYLIVTLGVILVIFIYNPFETRQTIPHPRPFTERPFETLHAPEKDRGERFSPSGEQMPTGKEGTNAASTSEKGPVQIQGPIPSQSVFQPTPAGYSHGRIQRSNQTSVQIHQDDRHLKELEKQNLQTELEYLKHQINPHFFMNTLNNIHALIDVDTEKAKESVIELSKIMRYILYDSSQPIISLQKEITLLNNYIALMRIRYTDSIDISVNIADNLPDVQIPPLLFISFIENAFKHGISYQHPSFVHIMLETREKELSFYIVNSNFSDTHNPSGIGLENVTKRLQLLYGDKYILETRAEENSFSVNLIIPIES